MYELLEDFLSNDEIRSLGKVEVLSFTEDGHKCKVYYKQLEDNYSDHTEVNLWDVLAYVHSKS